MKIFNCNEIGRGRTFKCFSFCEVEFHNIIFFGERITKHIQKRIHIGYISTIEIFLILMPNPDQ